MLSAVVLLHANLPTSQSSMLDAGVIFITVKIFSGLFKTKPNRAPVGTLGNRYNPLTLSTYRLERSI